MVYLQPPRQSLIQLKMSVSGEMTFSRIILTGHFTMFVKVSVSVISGAVAGRAGRKQHDETKFSLTDC